MKPVIAISMGDFNGIGPEVVLKALAKIDTDRSTPLWIGSPSVLHYYSKQLPVNIRIAEVDSVENVRDGVVSVYDIFDDEMMPVEPGTLSAKSGDAAMKSVDAGVNLCLKNKCHALVTAPISKESISMAGYSVPGHTEFLAERTRTPDVAMMLVSSVLRVALATIHIPLYKVANSLTISKIVETSAKVAQSLRFDFGIQNPKIALLGLNPHAGDGGVLGSEEQEIIKPAIKQLTQKGIDTEGPYAADGYFGNRLYRNFDATIAMYHDQGLIPFKTLSFGKGVNFTAGLPIIRTSPDHGTAFSIAGKNKADEHSFLEAYNLAVTLAENRFT